VQQIKMHAAPVDIPEAEIEKSKRNAQRMPQPWSS
jgi:hypothetical protein